MYLPSTAADEVYLVNQTQKTLHFSLRIGDEVWTNFEIESGDAETYQCAGECEEDIEFFMRTDDENDERYVHYILKYHERYALRWNSEKELWDIFRVTEPVRSN